MWASVCLWKIIWRTDLTVTYNIKNKTLKIIITILVVVSFVLITLSSIVFLYEKRTIIFNKLNKLTSVSSYDDEEGLNESKFNLAKKIQKGGYILFFRHANREKWIDVTTYDSIEIGKNLKAEDTYFKDAVCLSKRGLIQAKMMGEIIKDIKLPIKEVITSPSCRARQTAELAFGGYDVEKNILLHRGPYNESSAEHQKNLKKLILEMNISKDSNIIISGYNSVIYREVVDEVHKHFDAASEHVDFFTLEEGGFYVMKIKNNKLVLIDKFHNFNDFNKMFQTRPKN